VADPIQTLVVNLEARVNQFERTMAKASATANKRATEIEGRIARANRQLAGFGIGAFKGLAGGAALALAPILSASAAINGAKDALEAFGAVSDSAKASGLDAEFFQGLAYQAKLAGVDMGSLSSSLATFNRNSGLADAGTGRMVAALQKLNPELLDSIRAATTQEQRIRLAADALNEAGSASEKAALAVALFGESGTRLVDAFAGGAASIDSMQAKAKTLGLIVDRDLIARADDLGDQFDTVTQIVDLQLKSALVSLGPILIYLTQLTGNLASTIGFVVEGLKATGDQSTAALEQRLAQLQSGGQGIAGKGGTAALEAAEAKRQKDIADVMAVLRSRAMDSLTEQLSRPTLVTPEMPEDGELPGLGGSGSDAAQSAIAHGEAVQKLVADLQFEKQILGETALEQEILNTLRNAGVDAASAEGLAIRGLVTELDAQKSAMKATAEAMQAFEGIAETALSSFISDLREGKSGAEALGSAMNSILDNVIQIGVQSLVGGLFGGGSISKVFGFANGGIAANGKPLPTFARGGVSRSAAIFGEAGPEAAVPLPDGRSIPVKFIGTPGPVANQNQQTGGALTVHVTLDSDMLRAEVVNTAGRVVASAAPSIIRAANDHAPGAVVDKQMRFGG
jgi:hypothetical protein